MTFKPSSGTFTKVEFDFAVLERRLRELAFLNSGLEHRPARRAARAGGGERFCYEGGLIAFVEWLDRGKIAGVDGADHRRRRRRRQRHPVEFALSWNDSFHETMLCFTNNIPQRDGGSHLAGFRQALTRVVAKYAEGMGKKDALAWSARTCARA